MTTLEKKQKRGALVNDMRALYDKGKANGGALSEADEAAFDRLDLEQGRLAEEIHDAEPRSRGRVFAGRDGLDALERELRSTTTDSGLRPSPDGGGPRAVDADGREVRLLTNKETIRGYLATQPSTLPDGIRADELSLGRAVKAMTLGDWRHAPAEARAMGSTPGASGGFLMPSEVSATVIDAARARARVFQAGATTVPMSTKDLTLGRIATDPVAAWKGENAAGTATDGVFEAIELHARTLFGAAKVSVELMEDAANFSSTIEDMLANSLALKLDYTALRGGQTAGPIEPLGLRWYSGINTIALTSAVLPDNMSSAVQAIATANGPTEGLAAILSTRDFYNLDRMKDGNGLYLVGPPSYQALAKFPTTQIPTNLGAGSNESEVYVGAWPFLLIGMRTELTIEASRVAGDSTGGAFASMQVWVRAYLRADVNAARESFFTVITGTR